MPQRVLFISNGHGEDNHSAHIIRRLRELCPEVEIEAMAIVGRGNAYRQLGVPIICPTRDVPPSSGFSYVDRRLLRTCAQTIGQGPADAQTIKEAAQCLQATINNPEYLATCQREGPARLGPPGAGDRIAGLIREQLQLSRNPALAEMA